VINIDLFGSDMTIGDFKLSDYGMMLASFEGSSNQEDELGADFETIEEFVGHDSIPIYLGSKHTNKLKPKATIIKNSYLNDMAFTEHECREVIRQLTGFRGYRAMQIRPYVFDELLYFNVIVTNVTYKKVNGKVIGIILQLECESQFAWSKQSNISYNVKSGETIRIYNKSDDLNNYLYPEITISPQSAISNLEIVNLSDKNWTTIISNISYNEIITMDSKNEILKSSNKDRIIMNDFNMHFIRLVPGENQIRTNGNIKLIFSFRAPRKVGFMCG